MKSRLVQYVLVTIPLFSLCSCSNNDGSATENTNIGTGGSVNDSTENPHDGERSKGIVAAQLLESARKSADLARKKVLAGDYPSAVSHERHAVQEYEKVKTEAWREYLSTRLRLGILLRQTNTTALAMEQFLSAVKELESFDPNRDSSLWISAHQLVASARLDEGNIVEAEKALGVSMELLFRAEGKNEKGLEWFAVSNSLTAISLLEAKGQLTEAICSCEKLLEEEPSYYNEIATACASLKTEIGETVWATEKLKEISTEEKDPLLLAETLYELGNALRVAGEYQSALDTLDRGMSLINENLGEKSPVAIKIDGERTKIYIALGRMEEAKVLGDKVRKNASLQWGEFSFPALSADVDIGIVLAKMGENDASRKVLLAAKDKIERKYSPNHPMIATIELWLGKIDEQKGQRKEATDHYRKALGITEKKLRPSHPISKEIASVLNKKNDQ